MAAIVHYFTADPLRSSHVERIGRDLGLPMSSVQPVLDHLVAIGVLERKKSEPNQAPVYVSRMADQFLDILERLSNYFNEQIDDIAVSPERAALLTGEPNADVNGIRSLRARVASLESANALLQRKNLELSFLYEASTLLSSSIDLTTLGQTLVNAVVNASSFKVSRCFIVLTDGDAFIFQSGYGVERLEAEQFIFSSRTRLLQSVESGEVITTGAPSSGDAASAQERQLIFPMIARSGERGYGCIVITRIEEPGLSGEDLRTLSQLAELGARSLANASLYSRSVALGMTDQLTGMLNRRYLDRRLADEAKRAQRGGTELSAILLDLDYFKPVNDRYGHLEGDRMLQAVARTISQSVRDIDVVTRFGGEEFAIILPGAGARDCYTVAERVRVAVEKMQHVTADGEAVQVTISCGTASLRDNVHTPAQLIAAADQRLLEAKRSGRNRTVAEASPAAPVERQRKG